jgi:hypothetical protein
LHESSQRWSGLAESRLAVAFRRGCRVNPASPLATVGTSNARRVSRVREATECGRARRLAVAVGDFHIAQPFPDSLRHKERAGTSRVAAPSRRKPSWLRAPANGRVAAARHEKAAVAATAVSLARLGDCESRGHERKSARPISEPMLCLRKSRATRGLAARMLLVRGGSAEPTGDALAPIANTGVLRCAGCRPLTGHFIGPVVQDTRQREPLADLAAVR